MNLNNREKKRKNSFHNSKKEVFQVCETACIAIVTPESRNGCTQSDIYIYISPSLYLQGGGRWSQLCWWKRLNSYVRGKFIGEVTLETKFSCWIAPSARNPELFTSVSRFTENELPVKGSFEWKYLASKVCSKEKGEGKNFWKIACNGEKILAIYRRKRRNSRRGKFFERYSLVKNFDCRNNRCIWCNLRIVMINLLVLSLN